MRSLRSRTLLALVLAAVVLGAAPIPASAQVGDAIGDRIVGQPDPTSNTPNVSGVDASGLMDPYGMAFDAAGDLFVADTGNCRVLGYRSPFTTDMVADIVIGQPDFNSNTYNNGGVTASSLSTVIAVVVDPKGNLYVSDYANGRVLEYDRPLATDAVADLVIGQPDFVTGVSNEENVDATTLFSPRDLALDPDGNLWVADTGHRRVLEYENPIATRDVVADLVLGQPSFTTSSGYGNAVDARTLDSPSGLALDSDGNVWVADESFDRVLEYDDPAHSDAVADRVLGQPSFTSSARNYTGAVDASGLYAPACVRVDANGNVTVADALNNRVLVYTAPIATMDRVADRVFGQPDFASSARNNGGVSAHTFNTPVELALDASGDLAVADLNNHRVVLLQTPTPIVSSIQVKLSAPGGTKLVVRGFGMQSGRVVVEVDGVQLSSTRYKNVADDGSARRVIALDADFESLVPRGVAVTVVVVNPQSGGRSAPISFTRR